MVGTDAESVRAELRPACSCSRKSTHLTQGQFDQFILTQTLSLHCACYRGGDDRVHDPVHPPGNNHGAVSLYRFEPFGYALLCLHRLHGHGVRSKAELCDHGCIGESRGQHSHIYAHGPELDVKRFAEAVNKRFCGAVVGDIGNAIFRAHGPHEQQSAFSALCEPLAEVVGDVEMRQRIESQALLQLAPVDLEERAWMWGPRIGHHKADIEIVGELSEMI